MLQRPSKAEERNSERARAAMAFMGFLCKAVGRKWREALVGPHPRWALQAFRGGHQGHRTMASPAASLLGRSSELGENLGKSFPGPVRESALQSAVALNRF